MNKITRAIEATILELIKSQVPQEVRIEEMVNLHELGNLLDDNQVIPMADKLAAQKLACSILKLTESAGHAGILALAIAGSITQTRIALTEFGTVLADMDLDWEDEEPTGAPDSAEGGGQ